MSDEVYVNEIFYSIDGEGGRAGYPAVFVRLSGCNLRCNYCDTGYALKQENGVKTEICDVVQKVKNYKCRHITLTGGEPLLQKNVIKLLAALSGAGRFVTIETNGAVSIKKALPYASICMDWKVPSSGMNEQMMESNLKLLRPYGDVLKIVARSADLPYIKDFLDSHVIDCPVYISPVFGEITLQEIAEFVKGYEGQNSLRMQVQLHKIIWEPNKRGV